MAESTPPVDKSTVVMSIRPVYADRILDGTKTVEFRRKPLPEDVENVLIWRTGKGGGFVASFEIGGQRGDRVTDWLSVSGEGEIAACDGAGVEPLDLVTYAGGLDESLTVIGISGLVRFPRLLAGWELGTDRAPQSWRYAHAKWRQALEAAS